VQFVPGRLLLIQPHGIERDSLLEVLEQAGYSIVVSGNSEHGLKLLKSERFDIVLVSDDLPEIKDGTMLQAMRSTPSLKHVPILGITNDLDSAATLMHTGADDFIVPPYKLGVLEVRLKNFIEKHHFRHRSLEYSDLVTALQTVILPIGLALTTESNFDRLLERILRETKALCNADAGTLYIRTEDDLLKFAILSSDSLNIVMGGTTGIEITLPPLRLYDAHTGQPNYRNVSTCAALEGKSINVPDIYASHDFDFSATQEFDRKNNYRSVSTLTIPLKNSEEVIGVLQLLNARDKTTGEPIPFSAYDQLVVETLGTQAAIALNSQITRLRQERLIKLERDLQIGRQIQMDFLPEQLPTWPGWEIAARFRPAREVSGDFYDSFMIAGDRVGLVIADVCDKGVGPAMFMALMRSFIRAFTQQRYSMNWQELLSDSPSSKNDVTSTDLASAAQRKRLMLSPGAVSLYNALTMTNNYVATVHTNLNMFATMFVGLLDPSNGRLLYINGGHNPPMIIGSDGTLKHRLKPSGPAVGMLADAHFEIMEVCLEPCDTLIAFTDGVTDAKNGAGTRFTEAALLQLLTQPTESATVILDKIMASLETHIGEAAQFDDITMLAARYVEHGIG
jgi:sigma-B regulation protein RsbU (phosphoserine phosphatase)